MKKILLIAFILSVFLAAPALGIPSLGWWQEGAAGSTHQYWDFTPGYVVGDQLNPEDVYNPGDAIGQRIFGTWDGSDTIYGSLIVLDLKIDNWVDNEPYKEIWVDLGLTNGHVDFDNTSVVAGGHSSPYSYVTIQQPAPNAVGTSFGFRIFPNPDWENIAIVIDADGAAPAVLDWVHVDTISIPAPGAILLGGIGVCLVGWLRRRRTL